MSRGIGTRAARGRSRALPAASLEVLLELADQLQEEERDERDRRPDDRGEHEQDGVGLAPQQLQRRRRRNVLWVGDRGGNVVDAFTQPP